MKDLLLITPPFTQLNTPYPATAYLKGFLNTKGISAFQMDLGIEVLLEMFSAERLASIFSMAEEEQTMVSDNARKIYALRDSYIQTIDEVISFLQGKSPSLARQICSERFLPQASRFDEMGDMVWAFGNMGLQDKAKHFATLYLEDISDFIVECIDSHFGFSRYAERLGRSANAFDELYAELQQPRTYVDEISCAILEERIEKYQPKLVCLSVPFPGNLYSAFRCAQFIKTHYPTIKVAMGGGFPNTELRSVSDARVFSFFDFITLDDGELPIELLTDYVLSPPAKDAPLMLKRTFLIDKQEVVYNNFALRQDYKQKDVGTPDYSDLLLESYVSVIEIANSMHSLWSDGRWNKLTMAHGCYWGKCTFCDVSLDYIKNYEPVAAKMLVDRMEQLIEQTGERGFHFVDEAAPPALMRELAIEILRRKLVVSWWTNIRFEKSFTHDLCRLLMASGCIAVSGGLEVASDRLLKLIKKGVSVEQVAQVTSNFTRSGIMVHAYLMYGYPTQTKQETIDSLEMVRQLFEEEVLHSGFWHQFALTAHSPVGMNPDEYGIIPRYEAITFANNDVQFTDKTGIDHDQFSYGLKKSLLNYMHGLGFDYALQEWFDFRIPKTKVPRYFIHAAIENNHPVVAKDRNKLLWTGATPVVIPDEEFPDEWVFVTFYSKQGSFELNLDVEIADWIVGVIARMMPTNEDILTLADLRTAYEKDFDDFDAFWHSEAIEMLREEGLLIV